MAEVNQDLINLITEELQDLDRQVAVGDLEKETAEELRAKYESELASLVNRGAEVSGAQASDSDGSSGASRFSGRALVGTAVVAIAVTVIGVFAVNSLTGPSTAGVEGVASDVVTGEGGIDLSQVSNEEMEAVVAENPEIITMRLALARRYFEAGEFDSALTHYMVVLEGEKHPEALANVGWMTYISGRPDIALEYVEAALERQPGFLTATWFLGNIQFELGNFPAAKEALSTIVEAGSIPDDVRDAAETLIARIEQG
jgi:tetratricopeptide (TPR) repeat protein